MHSKHKRPTIPKFIVLSRRDALVDYVTTVEAEDARAAADLVHEGDGFVWEERGVVEFDAAARGDAR